MGGNGLSIANNSADIEFTDGVDTYGFRIAPGHWWTETRGDAYAGQISSGGQNYEDGEPWKRKVYDNFLGGFGQVSDNKVTGGTGIGGDDTKYFYADAKTDRAGYLLPGMARNFIYNTIIGAALGFGDNTNEESEVPRGVIPVSLSPNYQIRGTLTGNGFGNITNITNIRALIQLRDSTSSTSYTITCAVYNLTTFLNNFTVTLTPSSVANQYNGWAWVTLTGPATVFATNSNINLYFFDNSVPASTGPIAALGCYVGNTTNIFTGGVANANVYPALLPNLQTGHSHALQVVGGTAP